MKARLLNAGGRHRESVNIEVRDGRPPMGEQSTLNVPGQQQSPLSEFLLAGVVFAQELYVHPWHIHGLLHLSEPSSIPPDRVFLLLPVTA